MGHVTYNTRLVFKDESDKEKIFKVLEAERFAWNECSKIKFEKVPKNSIVDLHAAFYRQFRDKYPEIPAQIVVRATGAVLSIFRSIKTKKEKVKTPPIKSKLSIRLDKKLFSYKNGVLKLSSFEKRVKCSFYSYPKLEEYLNKYKFCDPLLFERDGDIWISLTFDIPEPPLKPSLACGVDFGVRNFAATSEGKLYKDKKFCGEKRKLRFNKRKLQSAVAKGSKSAKRHLKKLRRKEHNKNQNFTHHLSKRIVLDTKADVLVLEDLKSIKVKKHKYQNKNRISQVPLYELRRMITYKAPIYGKTVMVVSPSYTSQIDHRTGKRDGVRSGSRYTGKDGQLLHADTNAACNIALRSKLPCSISNYFVWQAVVNQPIVGCGTHKLLS